MVERMRPAGQLGGGAGRDWRRAAGCRDVDPELFFPAAESGPVRVAQEAAATAVCRRCQVLAECRRWAIEVLPVGVAGGMTEQQRRTARAGQDQRARAGRWVRVAVPIGGTRREVAAAGRAAVAAGEPVVAVAARFGVAVRTAARWQAATARAGTPSTTASVGGGV